MKNELQKIANTLVLYSYHITGNGLHDGKMGIILFLYRYADYSNCKYYSEIADDMLDKVLRSIATTSPCFENGLAGIGLVVNCLIRKGYVDGDSNEVLQDVDKKIFSDYKCNPHTSLLGKGIYLLERLKDNKTNVDYIQHIDECLDSCDKGLSIFQDAVSLYHINSVLIFLMRIKKYKHNKEKAVSIKKNLLVLLEKILNHKTNQTFDKADLYIFERVLKEFELEKNKVWKKFLMNRTKPENGFDIETLIKISWQEELYFGNSSLEAIALGAISRFINLKQESLTKRDFIFSRGLAGFGNMLLFMNENANCK
ncbi:MAG: hypothetical protein LBR67_05545 [Dysgonamonadaceae bacterium]|jgi:hypothetical protein|nr:hypothetical protein [Dysgonamonadaceae bacterium]